MFPSNSYLISSSDQPFPFESNPKSSREESNIGTNLPFSFLDFPFPFEDTENFLLQFQHQPLAEPHKSDPQPEVSITKKKFPSKGGKHMSSTEQIQKKTPCSRKDRHSKIHTSSGLRDRRMRLSLQVAKRFFGLQDMLGFDKASKTVEWLLNQAKVEINQLASSTSECEGAVSSLEEVVVNEIGNQEQEEKEDPVVKRRRTKRSRKSALHHPLSKECRERARERARERTKEKMRLKQYCIEETSYKVSQLGSWNLFETGEVSVFKIQGVNPSLDLLAEAKEQHTSSKEHWGTVEAMCYEQRLPIHDFQFSQ